MVKLEDILKRLSSVPVSEREALLKDLELLEKMRDVEKARLNFLDFVQRMWPAFIAGTTRSWLMPSRGLRTAP